jgi:SAM-dependent methyltransferase
MNVARLAGQWFARLATNAVVRRPALWRLFRGPMRLQFDALASDWDRLVSPGHLDVLPLALDGLEPPRRALDLGTGTGDAASAVAERFPDSEVTGFDLSPGMVGAASANLPPELAGRVEFRVGDASALPVPDATADLVTLANMIPFFDELARVTAPGGSVVCVYSWGASTPIYVPAERLRRELGARGFTDFADFTAGEGTAFRARRA